MASQMARRLGVIWPAGLAAAALMLGLFFAVRPAPIPGAPQRVSAAEPQAADSANDADETSQGEATSAGVDPSEVLGQNMACYVCHMTFVHEELAKTHLEAEVGCVKCHGLSAAHANDEDIGATPPDIVFARDEVDPSCRKCHAGHDVSARLVVQRFVQRQLNPSQAAVCTDCHGDHRIAEATAGMPEKGE